MFHSSCKTFFLSFFSFGVGVAGGEGMVWEGLESVSVDDYELCKILIVISVVSFNAGL